jgi:recombinational DNA repair ATPase RecF
VDEQAVLKHFDWPEKRADALRDAAAKHEWLVQLDKQISSFVDDHALHRDAALGKMYSLFEKTEKSVHKFLLDRDARDTKINLISRYKEQDIPVGWMSDTGLIVKVHFPDSFMSYY